MQIAKTDLLQESFCNKRVRQFHHAHHGGTHQNAVKTRKGQNTIARHNADILSGALAETTTLIKGDHEIGACIDRLFFHQNVVQVVAVLHARKEGMLDRDG